MAHELQDDLPVGLSVATEVDTYEESSDSEENSEGEDHNSDSDVILAESGELDENLDYSIYSIYFAMKLWIL